MSNVLIFGHKNPDTDTICSAIAYAHLKNQLGIKAEAVRLGEINGETEYALKTFSADPPRLVETVSNETNEVILVDHNEFQQSASDIKDVRVLEVIDHHRIANFETADPLYYRAEPVGCTATILLKIYKEKAVEIEKDIAGLMLSAIVSDSLLFKSPTCTEEDVAAAKELAQIADVDLNQYGLDMLKAGADTTTKTVQQLITIDAKEFSMGEFKVEVAQVNTVDTNEVIARQAEIEPVLTELIADKKLDLFVLVVTDILENNSVVLALGSQAPAVEKAFNVTLDNSTALLNGVVSRKKQIVPPLTEALSS
ncbi:manganese-dependent inorganic pyrophosphatase [Alkalihalobacillus trypoxylicola]|uniref:Probable manganese-dependent inorganic pyrophosphatase n=1 Tax=Alkalihalobacillus trypoxylicola TaxID=519424 RepID=A0A162ES54_9BACI|nr:manganese-dependent inorganic pyrophosphatase [Alkalihalobacillus trypoxylicola]KYG33582.1 inorganic pyrophosphatase [Alkalihalobacillus trypoxylicola]